MATFLSLEWFVANALLVTTPERLRADETNKNIVNWHLEQNLSFIQAAGMPTVDEASMCQPKVWS